MQLKYNLVLVTTIITFQLNIYAFRRHDFIPCFLAKMCLLLLKSYKVVAISKCLRNIFKNGRKLVFAVLDRPVNCCCDNFKN